jgi:hypothetical protein
VEGWANFSKEEVLAWLNRSIAVSVLKSNPGDAIPMLLKALHFKSVLSKDPYTYYYLAAAYENGSYAKQYDEYKKLYGDKPESNDSKLALANINQVVERMVDGYARAVALAGSDSNKAAWMDSLTTWYKFLKKSDAGLADYIAKVLSQELPDVPKPLTTLPASMTTTGSATASDKPAMAGSGAAGSGAKPGSTTQTGSKPASAKPSPSPRAHP